MAWQVFKWGGGGSVRWKITPPPLTLVETTAHGAADGAWRGGISNRFCHAADGKVGNSSLCPE
ncbi:MAG: hypothetical protein LBB79_07045 [Prevotellaceae bacterium]|nr:hypothetical protein [Prevotellaceae bacterium]